MKKPANENDKLGHQILTKNVKKKGNEFFFAEDFVGNIQLMLKYFVISSRIYSLSGGTLKMIKIDFDISNICFVNFYCRVFVFILLIFPGRHISNVRNEKKSSLWPKTSAQSEKEMKLHNQSHNSISKSSNGNSIFQLSTLVISSLLDRC